MPQVTFPSARSQQIAVAHGTHPCAGSHCAQVSQLAVPAGNPPAGTVTNPACDRRERRWIVSVPLGIQTVLQLPARTDPQKGHRSPPAKASCHSDTCQSHLESSRMSPERVQAQLSQLCPPSKQEQGHFNRSPTSSSPGFFPAVPPNKGRSGKTRGSAAVGSPSMLYPGIPVSGCGHSANGEKTSPLHASFPSCVSQSRASTGRTESNHRSDEQEMFSPLCKSCLNRT